MNSKHRSPAPPLDSCDSFFAKEQQVASMTECTGLVQVPPDDAEEADSLSEIYDIPLAGGQQEQPPHPPQSKHNQGA